MMKQKCGESKKIKTELLPKIRLPTVLPRLQYVRFLIKQSTNLYSILLQHVRIVLKEISYFFKKFH